MANAKPDKCDKMADFLEELDDVCNVTSKGNILLTGSNLVMKPRTVTSSVTMDKNDSIVFCAHETNTITFTLLSAKGDNTGPLQVVRKGAGPVVIAAPAGEKINGQSTYTIGNQSAGVTLVSDSKEWSCW